MGFIEELQKTKGGRKTFERERVLFEATEMIAAAMEEKGLSKAGLARLLGTQKSYITQLLSGKENMTLAKVSDVLFELNKRFSVLAEPLANNGAEVDIVTYTDPWLQRPNIKITWSSQPAIVEEGEPLSQVA